MRLRCFKVVIVKCAHLEKCTCMHSGVFETVAFTFTLVSVVSFFFATSCLYAKSVHEEIEQSRVRSVFVITEQKEVKVDSYSSV